jgi:tetratricopeptide (TPR) repeat protein
MTRFGLIFFIKVSCFCVAVLFFLCQKSFANQNSNQPTKNPTTEDQITTTKAIDQIQQTLIYSNTKKTKQDTKKSLIIINKNADYQKSKNDFKEEIEISITNQKNNAQEERKQKLAHKASLDGQYEVSIELYKQILQLNPTNQYAELALASCYHLIGQYSQAKTLYYKLLKYDWQNKNSRSELINNFILLIVEESPLEAIYLLKELSNQNPGSDYIIAGAAMAYDKINQPDKTILLLKKAININPKEIKYKFNLAIIYDKIGDYKNAINYYQDTINSYTENKNLESRIPVNEVRQRIQFIQNKI